MTGTAVQNSLNDLASLIKLLRVPLLDDATNFRRHIAGRRSTAGGVPKPDYENLKLLLGPICLRRGTAAVLSNLGVTFVKRRLRLSGPERRAYDELAVSCDQSIKAAVNGPSARGGNVSILTAVLKLRIFCNTGLASPVDGASEGVEEQFRPDEVISLLQQSGEAICAECSSEMLASGVGGGFTKQLAFSRRRLKCQGCTQRASGLDDAGIPLGEGTSIAASDMMQDVHMEDERGSAPTTETPDYGLYSSKLKVLLADIKEHHSQIKRQANRDTTARLLLTAFPV